MLQLADSTPPTPTSPQHSVLDLTHLTRMALGDRRLEMQVLELFDRQAELFLLRMVQEPSTIARLAHTLVGSARGIGAWQVAAAAETLARDVVRSPVVIEDIERPAVPPPEAMARLESAVNDVRLAIRERLRAQAA
jgi:HPt (histidine-containing phosphotransfer) domain-containing protein